MADPVITIDIGGVPCTIFVPDGIGESSIVESVTEQGPQATVLLKCPWVDRYAVLAGLGGGSTGSGGSIVRVKPFAYPDSPNLFCTSIPNIRGIKFRRRDSDGWGSYEEAIITAVFGTPRWGFDENTTTDPSGQPWTTTRIRVNAEVFIPPGGVYYYSTLLIGGGGTVDDGKPVREGQAGIIVPHDEISMTRHWMPFLPISQVNQYIGTVNNQPVTIGGQEYDTGRLLFAGFNGIESADTIGNRVYEVEYILLGNPIHSWNRLMDTAGAWHIINTVDDESGTYPYAYTDYYVQLP